MLKINSLIIGFFISILINNYSSAGNDKPIKLYSSDDGFEVYSSGYEVRDIKGKKTFIHYFLLKNNTDKERELSIYPGFSMHDDIGNSYIKQLVYMRDGKHLKRSRHTDKVAPKSWIKAGIVIKGFDPKCNYLKVKYTFGYSGEYTFYKKFKNNKPKITTTKPSDIPITKKSDKPIIKDRIKKSDKKVTIDSLDFEIKEKQFSQDFSIKNNTDKKQTIIISNIAYINDDLGNKFDSTSLYINNKVVSIVNNMSITLLPGEDKKIKIKINGFDSNCKTFKARYAFKLPSNKEYSIMFVDYENK